MHSFLLCNINNGTSTNYIPDFPSLELEGQSKEPAMGTENLLFVSQWLIIYCCWQPSVIREQIIQEVTSFSDIELALATTPSMTSSINFTELWLLRPLDTRWHTPFLRISVSHGTIQLQEVCSDTNYMLSLLTTLPGVYKKHYNSSLVGIFRCSIQYIKLIGTYKEPIDNKWSLQNRGGRYIKGMITSLCHQQI